MKGSGFVVKPLKSRALEQSHLKSFSYIKAAKILSLIAKRVELFVGANQKFVNLIYKVDKCGLT